MQTHLTAPSYPNVAMVQADDYSQQTIERAVRRVFAELEISPELFRDKNVLVKPNLLMRRRPEEATTTHPQVMRAVILRLQEMGAKQVVIADSPGGLYTPAQLRSIYSACGMQQVAEETGALLNLETGSARVPARDPKMCTEFNLIDPVRQADVIVSVGKLKTHCMTGLSGGVKNLFGCIPGLQKPQLHYRYQNRDDFCSMLVDLAQTVAPVLTVMDGGIDGGRRSFRRHHPAHRLPDRLHRPVLSGPVFVRPDCHEAQPGPHRPAEHRPGAVPLPC